MANYFTRQELARLREMRTTLLGIETRKSGEGAPRYWKTPEDVALYDSTFGARIGWKWNNVLDELEARGLAEQVLPRDGLVLDWACGSGVAARAVAARAESGLRWQLWDRDAGARGFAAERLREARPRDEVQVLTNGPESDGKCRPDLLLISHVLDELEDSQVHALLGLVRRSKAVLWVEPGSRITSRRLSGLREELRQDLGVVAPCPHTEMCGMLREGAERHWCHLFGASPGEAFTEGRWAEFAKHLEIDLRSLPYCYLALAKDATAPAPDGTARLLGRPRLQRGMAQVDLCRADGMHEARLLKRLDKALFKRIDEPGEALLFDLDLDGPKIERIARIESPDSST